LPDDIQPNAPESFPNDRALEITNINRRIKPSPTPVHSGLLIKQQNLALFGPIDAEKIQSRWILIQMVENKL